MPHKDPARVATGRMGALAVHARGRTNVGPARAAWEASLASEFGIGDDLTPVERDRRMQSAMRLRMSQLARGRWAAKKKAEAEGQSPASAEPEVHGDARPAA